MLPAAVIVANNIRPIICDVSCRYGDPLASSVLKAEKIAGIGFEFQEGSIDSGDQIVLKNALGKTTLVKRSLDGKSGYVTFGHHGFPCGKAKLYLTSDDKQFRRANVIVWVVGERVTVESM